MTLGRVIVYVYSRFDLGSRGSGAVPLRCVGLMPPRASFVAASPRAYLSLYSALIFGVIIFFSLSPLSYDILQGSSHHPTVDSIRRRPWHAPSSETRICLNGGDTRASSNRPTRFCASASPQFPRPRPVCIALSIRSVSLLALCGMPPLGPQLHPCLHVRFARVDHCHPIDHTSSLSSSHNPIPLPAIPIVHITYTP